VGVEYLYPTGNTLQQHSRVGDTTNYLCVDDRGDHDGDTSYIYTAWNPSPDGFALGDIFTMSNPVLRSGTIEKVTYGAIFKLLNWVDVADVALNVSFTGGASGHSPVGNTTGGVYESTDDLRPGYYSIPYAQHPWTFADVDSLKLEAITFVFPLLTNEFRITKVWAAVHATRPRWKESVLSQHTFLQDADTALKVYLTDASITHSDVASLVSFLSTVEFEVTKRDPVEYAKGMFPRVHIFTERARSIDDETRTTVQMQGVTTLKVWTLDADPNTAASQNRDIVGAVCSALEQARYVGGNRDWNTDYANWDDISLSVSMPEFIKYGDMRGLCLSTITATWKHYDD
jgi:hypothetical protein